MKRVLIVLATMLLAVGLSAQSVNYDVFGDAFEDFASEISTTLPSTAAVAGLNWSPAHIGQFPHFGVGASIGAFTIPYDFVEPLISELNLTLPSEFDYIKKWGMPIPALALDARIGGFLIPFDIGLKFAYIPDQLRDKLGKVNVDYLLVGGDVRFPVIKGQGFLPTVSIGGGYTHMKGSIGIPDVAASTTIDLPPPFLVGDTLDITSPELTFALQTNTFVGKVQASWNLYFLTPHVGLGAAYGLSSAGGGLSSEVLYNGAAMTPADIQAIKDAFAGYGYTIDELDDTSIIISSDADGYSFWVYGGTALNIFFLRVDLSAMYNLVSKSYGGAVNVRIQF